MALVMSRMMEVIQIDLLPEFIVTKCYLVTEYLHYFPLYFRSFISFTVLLIKRKLVNYVFPTTKKFFTELHPSSPNVI